MTKLIVETKGHTQAYGHGDEQFARSDRPSVVRQSNFIQQKIGSGDLIVLAQVNDEATDVALAEAWAGALKRDKDGVITANEQDKVVSAFTSKFQVEGSKPSKAAKPAAE